MKWETLSNKCDACVINRSSHGWRYICPQSALKGQYQSRVDTSSSLTNRANIVNLQTSRMRILVNKTLWIYFVSDLYTFDVLVIVTQSTTHTGMSIAVFYMRHEDMCFTL